MKSLATSLSICGTNMNCFWLLLSRTRPQPLSKGVALQYILYSDLRPRSKRKLKVKVGFWWSKVKHRFCPVYSTTDTFTDSCVNVILQKFTRNRTKVKHDFQQRSKVKADFTLTVHLDRGRRSEYSEHWSATPLT